jgi:hypothetical protein
MRSLIRAAVRIIIIVMFILMVKMLLINAQWIAMNWHDSDSQYLYSQIGITAGQFVVYSAILALLWIKTDWIVRVIAGNIDDNEIVISTSNLDLVKVAMQILGMVLLATSVPVLLGFIAYHFRITHLYEELELSVTATQYATELRSFVEYIVKLVLGTWLLLGTRGITRAIDKVMNAPISKVEE